MADGDNPPFLPTSTSLPGPPRPGSLLPGPPPPSPLLPGPLLPGPPPPPGPQRGATGTVHRLATTALASIGLGAVFGFIAGLATFIVAIWTLGPADDFDGAVFGILIPALVLAALAAVMGFGLGAVGAALLISANNPRYRRPSS